MERWSTNYVRLNANEIRSALIAYLRDVHNVKIPNDASLSGMPATVVIAFSTQHDTSQED